MNERRAAGRVNEKKPDVRNENMKRGEDKEAKKKEGEDGEEERWAEHRCRRRETGICQTAGSLRNRALTFMGQAASTDKNLCAFSLCIIGLVQ